MLPGEDSVATAGERGDYAFAADADAYLLEGGQEIEQDGVEHLLIDGLAARQAEMRGEFLADLHGDCAGMGFAGGVEAVGQEEGRLQDRSGSSIDVELAAGEPAGVGAGGGVKQQKGVVAIQRAQFQHD